MALPDWSQAALDPGPLAWLLPFLGGYLCGTIPFALLLGRLRGVDLRRVGSGNLGATNAGRILGRPFGVAVYFLDAFKGWLPVWAAAAILPEHPEVSVAAALGAVLGHVFPFFLGFRGGKGVSTFSGTMLALLPLALLLAAVPFLLVALTTRVMALASLTLGLAVPLAIGILGTGGAGGTPSPILFYAILVGMLFFYTHRSNLQRLLAGPRGSSGGGPKNA